MTVTAFNDQVVSCAHMEPINGRQTFQESLDQKLGYPQLGKLFKLYKIYCYPCNLNNYLNIFQVNATRHKQIKADSRTISNFLGRMSKKFFQTLTRTRSKKIVTVSITVSMRTRLSIHPLMPNGRN